MRYKFNPEVKYARETINDTIRRMKKQGYIIPDDIRERLTRQPAKPWSQQIAELSNFRIQTGKKTSYVISGIDMYEFKKAQRSYNTRMRNIAYRIKAGGKINPEIRKEYERVKDFKYDDPAKFGRFYKERGKSKRQTIIEDIQRATKNMKVSIRDRAINLAITRKEATLKSLKAVTIRTNEVKKMIYWLEGATPELVGIALNRMHLMYEGDYITELLSSDQYRIQTTLDSFADSINWALEQNGQKKLFSDKEIEKLFLIGF